METIKWVQCIITFVKVSELESFSQAALSLNLSKSHVSKTVKYLEEYLGVALFLRSTRKVRLTSHGEEFLKLARTSLQGLEGTKNETFKFSDSPRGLLRVTLAGIFGENYIAPVLIKMARTYPELKIEMYFEARIVDLIEERFDVGVRIGHLPDSSLFAQKIGTRREFVCASPKYLKQHKTPLHPKDLIEHNCLGNPEWNFKIDGKMKNISLSGNLKTNNSRVLLSAALDGVGIIRLPGSYVYKHIKSGKLIPLLERYNEEKKDIWAVTPSRLKMNINVKTFLAELRDFLSSGYSEDEF